MQLGLWRVHANVVNDLSWAPCYSEPRSVLHQFPWGNYFAHPMFFWYTQQLLLFFQNYPFLKTYRLQIRMKNSYRLTIRNDKSIRPTFPTSSSPTPLHHLRCTTAPPPPSWPLPSLWSREVTANLLRVRSPQIVVWGTFAPPSSSREHLLLTPHASFVAVNLVVEVHGLMEYEFIMALWIANL